MRILIATDAWHPQVNGVVRTYERLAAEARAQGAEVVFLSPSEFRSLPCPAYRSIRLAIPDRRRADDLIEAARADFVHVATEGPVGLMARSFCQRANRPFTTAYHTKFPEYASALLSIPPRWCFTLLRRFHNAGAGTMVATQSLGAELRRRGFKRLMPWTRGVDAGLYHPRDVRLFGSDQPVFTGAVAWRGLVAMQALPSHLANMQGVNWLGPHGHVLHYPARRIDELHLVRRAHRLAGRILGHPGHP